MRLPPYATLLGAQLEYAADGTPVMRMPFAEAVLGRPGFLQGGSCLGHDECRFKTFSCISWIQRCIRR